MTTLWRVVVEVIPTSNVPDRYTAYVVASTDRGARRIATTAVERSRGIEARAIFAGMVPQSKTGLLILVENEQILTARN